MLEGFDWHFFKILKKEDPLNLWSILNVLLQASSLENKPRSKRKSICLSEMNFCAEFCEKFFL